MAGAGRLLRYILRTSIFCSLASFSPFMLLPTSHGLLYPLTLDFFLPCSFFLLVFLSSHYFHINFHSDPSWPYSGCVLIGTNLQLLQTH